jgi:hypothetical protein
MTGLVSLIVAARAYAAKRIAQHRDGAEIAAGIVMIGGFGLLGTALPVLI